MINQIVEFGRTRRGWLGVKIQTITEEIAESMGLDETGGALVASVTADGPADKAKMMQGDVIVEFNGHKLSTMRQLPRIVAETPVGEKVPVKVIRDGKEKIISVVVGELEKAEDEGLLVGSKDNSVDPKGGKASELDGTGVVVSAITPSMREMYSIPDSVDGLVVTKVDARSDAAMKGLVVGDVILEINQVPVVAVDEAQEQIEEIMADKSAKKTVLLLVDNQGRGDVRFVALKLSDKKTDSKKK